jgi:hypothetical protein
LGVRHHQKTKIVSGACHSSNKTTIEYALQDESLKRELLEYMGRIVGGDAVDR